MSPYVGDGSLCVLDSDGDGYPDQALETCTEADTQTYCSADTCRNAPNIDQRNTRPCNGSLMTGIKDHVLLHLHRIILACLLTIPRTLCIYINFSVLQYVHP